MCEWRSAMNSVGMLIPFCNVNLTTEGCLLRNKVINNVYLWHGLSIWHQEDIFEIKVIKYEKTALKFNWLAKCLKSWQWGGFVSCSLFN